MSFDSLAHVGAIVGALLLPMSSVQADVIAYVATPLGGNLWRYDYTVNNTARTISFDEWTVYFEAGKYELLDSPVAPLGWDPIVVQPDLGIPADGYYDALNLGAPLGDGKRVSGFSVSFAYFGSGSPGAQQFDLLDSATYSIVYAGLTSPIPEPSEICMMLLGLACTCLAVRRRSREGSWPAS